MPELARLQVDAARAEVLLALTRDPGWMPLEAVVRLLRCYGIELVETRFARSAHEAGRAAADLAGPVAVKAVVPELRHVSGVGGVRLGLRGSDDVSRGAREMTELLARSGHQAQGFLVRPMAPAGVELLVGVVHDASFGPVMACGAPGARPDRRRDIAVRITPMTDVDARDTVRSLDASGLLDVAAGSAAGDGSALGDLLLRVSALVEAHPEVAELDLDPVIVHPSGVAVVEARARVEIPAAIPPFGAR